jgi:hypothetical protein
MSSVRHWALVSATAALILVGPIIAFMLVIAAELLIDVVRKGGATAVIAGFAGAIGWILFLRVSRPKLAAHARSEEASDTSAVAAPSV